MSNIKSADELYIFVLIGKSTRENIVAAITERDAAIREQHRLEVVAEIEFLADAADCSKKWMLNMKSLQPTPPAIPAQAMELAEEWLSGFVPSGMPRSDKVETLATLIASRVKEWR